MMTLSPRWTMFLPGLFITIVGLALMLSLMAGPVTIKGVRFDIHTLIVGGLCVIVGYQMMTAAVAARMFAVVEEIGPPSPLFRNAFERFSLERGIILGLMLIATGLILLAAVGWQWVDLGFPDLDPVSTVRPIVVSTTLIALGFQTLLMSFLYHMFMIPRRRR